MALPDELSFESLLKPLQDITSKVWDIALTKALENYLVQINNGDRACVNFTEAAVLVQNSTNFYCKRVDLVHLGCLQFVEKLMDTYNKVFGDNRIMDVIIHDNLDPDNKEGDGQVVRKKRTVKTYASEDFEPMGPFVAESNITVNLDTIDKYAEKKKVILNTYPKITRKPNTSCPVFQTKGAEMGFKEEFSKKLVQLQDLEETTIANVFTVTFKGKACRVIIVSTGDNPVALQKLLEEVRSYKKVLATYRNLEGVSVGIQISQDCQSTSVQTDAHVILSKLGSKGVQGEIVDTLETGPEDECPEKYICEESQGLPSSTDSVEANLLNSSILKKITRKRHYCKFFRILIVNFLLQHSNEEDAIAYNSLPSKQEKLKNAFS